MVWKVLWITLEFFAVHPSVNAKYRVYFWQTTFMMKPSRKPEKYIVCIFNIGGLVSSACICWPRILLGSEKINRSKCFYKFFDEFCQEIFTIKYLIYFGHSTN